MDLVPGPEDPVVRLVAEQAHPGWRGHISLVVQRDVIPDDPGDPGGHAPQTQAQMDLGPDFDIHSFRLYPVQSTGTTGRLALKTPPEEEVRSMSTVTVLTPTIDGRGDMMRRAMESVWRQAREPDAVVIESDPDRTGAVATRNRALERVTTDWVAFLDDDDELLRHHIRGCMKWAEKTGADVVYPGCRPIGPDGKPKDLSDLLRFGEPFDPNRLRRMSYIPVTSLVRTELVKQVGGFSYPDGSGFEDWGLYLKLLDAGARFSHFPSVTWIWYHHGENTSGRGVSR